MITRTKKIGLVAVVASAVLLSTGCTPREEAFYAGAGTGVVVGSMMTSYNYPYYYDRPFYYYSGIYYYGGRYYDGYYYFKGRRLYGGHYYYSGYRYYNGVRYRAVPGVYGYYKTRKDYERRTYKTVPVRDRSVVTPRTTTYRTAPVTQERTIRATNREREQVNQRTPVRSNEYKRTNEKTREYQRSVNESRTKVQTETRSRARSVSEERERTQEEIKRRER